MVSEQLRRLKIAVATAVVSLTTFVGTAAASHDTLSCTPPESLNNLLSFLHTLEQIALLGGVGVGTLGFLVAGIYIMMPGIETTQKGKKIAKHVLLGVILLLAARSIMAFLITQFPVCG